MITKEKFSPYFLKLLLVLAFFFIFQWAGAKYLRVNNIAPDFILVFLIFFSLHTGGIFALSLAFFAGLLQDILFRGMLGANSFSFCLIAYLVDRLRNKLKVKECFYSEIIFVFFGSFFYIIFSAFFYQTPWTVELLIPKIFIFSFYNSFLFSILSAGTKRIIYG